VNELLLVRSTVVHDEGVPSNLSHDLLAHAGLSRGPDQRWGDEVVEVWTRSTAATMQRV